IGFDLKDENGITVFRSFDADSPVWSGCGREPGLYKSECVIPAHFLNEGRYYLALTAGIPHIKLSMLTEEALMLNINPPVSNEGPAGRLGMRRPGVIVPELEWHVRSVR